MSADIPCDYVLSVQAEHCKLSTLRRAHLANLGSLQAGAFKHKNNALTLGSLSARLLSFGRRLEPADHALRCRTLPG